MRRKVYRDNKYSNRRMNVKRKVLKRVVLGTAFGAIVIVAANMLPFNTVKADDEVTNNEIHIETMDNGDSIDFKNVEYPVDESHCVSKDSEKITVTDPFKVGSSPDKKMVIDYLASQEGQYIYKYAEEYGVDPNLMAAIAMQESSLNHNEYIPGGEMYCGAGVGLMQLESPSGEEITAYNYETGHWDKEYHTMDAACGVEENIKISCMMFQNKIRENLGNIVLATQSYNYGQGMIDKIFTDLYGKDANKVKQDYSNISWVNKVEEIHYSPELYLSGWTESKFGDGKYVEHVLRFCPSKEVEYKYGAYEYKFDLEQMKVTDMFEYGTTMKR